MASVFQRALTSMRTSEISGTTSSLMHLKAIKVVRGIGVRQVRLVCGLILFCYLLSHYSNHWIRESNQMTTPNYVYIGFQA